jgi:hypothetical protein
MNEREMLVGYQIYCLLELDIEYTLRKRCQWNKNYFSLEIDCLLASGIKK